jgi:glycogen synthase
MRDRSIHVLMTADTVGGVWTYALELIRTLRRLGGEVTLATMGGFLSPSQLREAAQLPNVTLYESKYKLEWMDEPWAEVDEAGAWLLEIAHSVQPDLVHLNNYVHGLLPWRVPVLVVGHSCVLSWWQAVKGEPAPAYWQTYQQRVQAGLRNADLVVAPTRAMLRALHDHYGPFTASKVIHNGRSPQFFMGRRKEPFVFSVGRLWDEAKNIDALDAIAPQLAWPIYVAGQEQQATNGVRHLQHVRPLGHLPTATVAAWMARASIYVLPARYEPFGLSVLEAALAGCALVLGDIASLRELWGEAARYVPPLDHEALAAVLQELIKQPAQHDTLAAAARAQAQQYQTGTMGEAYWQAYRALLRQSSPVATTPITAMAPRSLSENQRIS